MRILIYGAGAVGQTVGCILASDGHHVDLILRERFIDGIRVHGLSVMGIFGDFHVNADTIGLFTSLSELLEQPYDYVLITTKSYDTLSAVTDLNNLHNQSFTVVSLQNGCGNFELLIEHFGAKRSLAGRVITGFEIEHPGRVKITVTADDIHIGGYEEGIVSSQASTISEAVNHAGLPCVATPTIMRDLYAKLLYNCALNPLGAVLGAHYGALGDNPNARSIMNEIIREVFSVIKAMRTKTHWDCAEDYQKFFYEKQIPATYNHRPSMLQDIEQGKRTEVDALTGFVSEQGKKLGVPTPVCNTLSGIIHFMELHHKKISH